MLASPVALSLSPNDEHRASGTSVPQACATRAGALGLLAPAD